MPEAPLAIAAAIWRVKASRRKLPASSKKA